MTELPKRKAGIIACSGEELPEGTVTRLAALKVLHELRPDDTVTICLPLFLAGGEEDRTFARFYPTIAIDGCELRCAAHATEMHSAKPAASIVVNDIVAESRLGKPEGRRRLNEAGKQAVDIIAGRVAALVDEALGTKDRSTETDKGTASPKKQRAEATCSCGSGIPAMNLVIDGRTVEVAALPLIFQKLREAGRAPDEATAQGLLETVKIYNFVPPEEEESYRKALIGEYAAYCERESKQ